MVNRAFSRVFMFGAFRMEMFKPSVEKLMVKLVNLRHKGLWRSRKTTTDCARFEGTRRCEFVGLLADTNKNHEGCVTSKRCWNVAALLSSWLNTEFPPALRTPRSWEAYLDDLYHLAAKDQPHRGKSVGSSTSKKWPSWRWRIGTRRWKAVQLGF